MKSISVLFGGRLGETAFVPLEGEAAGKTAVALAVERGRQFPGVEKVLFLGLLDRDYPGLPLESDEFCMVRRKAWTRKEVLDTLSRTGTGFEVTFFAWADCPFLDPVLAGVLTERHLRYAAEYSYADGYPYGFAPELLSPGTAGILFNIDTDGDIPLERDALFQVIQKDINAFDIETEIAPADLRRHRLCLASDSRRNVLLLNRWLAASGAIAGEGGFPRAAGATEIIEKRPEILRTLPSFFNIQVTDNCPQSCSYCPWPGSGAPKKGRMPEARFKKLLDRIVDFAGDGVISLSLWGEPALYPEKLELFRSVFERQPLSLVVETSGIGWKPEELEAAAEAAKRAPDRTNTFLKAPLSWVVSLDAKDPARYAEIRGPGFAEASASAKRLLELFPEDTFVQAVRFKGAEDDIEAFYRYWKDTPVLKGSRNANHVIIQKYDHFCGRLPRLQASDLSPVRRQPCWHLMRDMNIAVDGTVLLCREDLDGLSGRVKRPNVFASSLEEIWESSGSGRVEPASLEEKGAGLESGKDFYLKHTRGIYPGDCSDCDEYYTYNF